MRCFLRALRKVAERAGLSGQEALPARGFRAASVARAIALTAILSVPLVVSATPAMAATAMASSKKVALIPSNGPVPPAGVNGQDGIMPTSQYVSGRPAESLDKFSFSDVPLNQITPAKLSQFDTVALIQVSTSALSSAAKSALAQFVANGGKLIIHDSDETHLNDYSWLLPGQNSTKIGAGCPGCGLTSGTSKINANSDLISANPGDPAYVNLAELQKFTDAVGDANLLVSDDARWIAAASGTNGKNEAGAQLAYANNNGLIIYNGFDTDMIDSSPAPPWRCVGYSSNYTCYANGSHPSADWLAQMWYSELNKSWQPASSSGLPQGTPVTAIGTPLPPSQAGLPSNNRCVAKRTLFLRLKKLVRKHPQVIQIDVYVNGRHVLLERSGHWRNVTLTTLPKKGSVVVKIVATTKRRYHLISKVKYRAC
jgi:hypothetical protein